MQRKDDPSTPPVDGSSPINFLPKDVFTTNILSRIPPSSYGSFASTNKYFHSIFNKGKKDSNGAAFKKQFKKLYPGTYAYGLWEDREINIHDEFKEKFKADFEKDNKKKINNSEFCSLRKTVINSKNEELFTLDDNRVTIIEKVAKSGNQELMDLCYKKVCEYYSKDDVCLINKKSKLGTTLLLHACELNQLSAIQNLINKGSDVNARNSDGYTPLFAAIRFKHDDIVKLLIENGADVVHKPFGITSKHYLFVLNKYFLEHPADDSSLYHLLYKNNPSELNKPWPYLYSSSKYLLAFLLEKGTDPDIIYYNLTILSYAAYRGDLPLVKNALDKNANPFIIYKSISNGDLKKKTAYDIAVEEGHDEIAELIKEHENKFKLKM